MNTTIKSLQDLYVKLGGELTDTYEGIADGAAVGNYTTIPDMIEAVKEKATSGGGEGGDGNPVLPILMLKAFEPQSFTDNDTTYYCLGIRTEEQLVKGGMDDLTIDDFESLGGYWRGSNATYSYLCKVFDSKEQEWYSPVWHNTDILLAICAIEATDPYDLWKQVADAIYAAVPDESGWDIRIQSANQALMNYYTKTETIEQISSAISSGVAHLVGCTASIPAGETSIAAITTINSGETNPYNLMIYIQNLGAYVKVDFYDGNNNQVGAQNAWLFGTVDNTNPDNPIYTIGFHFFDGTDMRLASFTGGSEDTAVFTVASAP